MTLMERLEKDTVNINNSSDGDRGPHKPDTFVLENESYWSLIDKIQERIIQQSDKETMERSELESKVAAAADEIIKEDNIIIKNKDRQKLIYDSINEIAGFGPITVFLEDPEVTEVMVNGSRQIFVERAGKLEETSKNFRNDEQVMHLIDKIVSPLGRRIDEASPMVDARLPDGSRVNAIIPPLALNGPVLTIRKFSKDPYSIDDLISFGTLNMEMASFLKLCVKSRLNILVSGGTSSGKTTTLNVLSSFIPDDERIITIEDAAELQLSQGHTVRLESRPVNIEGKGRVSIRDLVRNALRMRPDRIIVGEVRSEEAIDMLQDMNTGHDGSLTTGHSNSPRDMLARVETMVMMSGMNLPLKAIREQISSAIDLIIQQTRFKDGSRKITHITEVQGMEGDVITLQDIFNFKTGENDVRSRVTGEFVFSGLKPRLLSKINNRGLNSSSELFK